MINKNGPNDDIGWVIGGIFKCLYFSLVGIIKIIINPIKCVLNLIILVIIGFIIYKRISNHCIVGWPDVILLIGFFKILGYTWEKGSLVKN